MKILGISLIVIGLIAAVLGLTVVGMYNGLVSQRENVDTSWAQVETQYQRRFDLIPNLVSATKGFLVQEQTVFGDIAEARTRYAGAPAGSSARVEAASGLESALGRLLVIMENYPQLKSNETVASLMDELAGTENRINVARQRYNEQTRDYNIAIKTFPRNIMAGIAGFNPKPLFEAQKEAETAPKVDLEIKK